MLPRRTLPSITVSSIAALCLAVGCSIHGKSEKPTPKIMEEGFKGKESLSARIGLGQASSADHMKMVELTRQLSLNRPPRGNIASWRAKTDALYTAAVNLSAKKPGAVEEWKLASDCKACHSVHRPEQKGEK